MRKAINKNSLTTIFHGAESASNSASVSNSSPDSTNEPQIKKRKVSHHIKLTPEEKAAKIQMIATHKKLIQEAISHTTKLESEKLINQYNMEIADSDNLELISRLEELENKLKNSEDLKDKYSSNLETLKQEITDLKNVQKKSEEFEKINAQFRQSQSDNEKLRKELTKVSEASGNFKKEAQKWKDKHDALEGQLDTLDKELTKCKDKNAQLILEAKAANTALLTSQSKVANMEEARTTHKRKFDEMVSNHAKEIQQLKVSHAIDCAAQTKQIAEKIRNLADSISGKEKL